MPDDLRALGDELAERLGFFPSNFNINSQPYDAEAQIIEAMAKRGWDCCERDRESDGAHRTRFDKWAELMLYPTEGAGSSSPLATARAALDALKSEAKP